MPNLVLFLSLGLLGIGVVLCLWRVIRGPSHFDRALSLDCMVLQLLGMVLLFSIWTKSAHYIDIILIVGLLGFVGTVSIAYFLEGKQNE